MDTKVKQSKRSSKRLTVDLSIRRNPPPGILNKEIEDPECTMDIAPYGSVIHDAVRMRCGITGWYSAYVGSDEFLDS